MATGTKADFKIYPDQFFGGMMEVVAQNLAVFNAASRNTFLLTSRLVRGDYENESFVKLLSGLISRRDPTVTTTVTDATLAHGEITRIKLNRRIGPVAQTHDAWKKISRDPMEMSFRVGQQAAEQKLQEMINTAIAALEGFLGSVTALNHGPTGATLNHAALVSGLSKRGDASQDVVAWVMHSKPFFDLLQNSITDKIFGVANLAIFEAKVGGINRPFIVTDSPSLVNDNGSNPDTYNTLGLVAGAVHIEESEEQTVKSEDVLGTENILMRVQGEYAYNVELKGAAWDVAGAGVNPTDAALATGSNWTKVATDNKHLGGVRIETL